MPELQNEHAPQYAGTIASAAHMLVNKSAHSIGLEISALQRTRFEQHAQELLFQFVAHPVHEGKLKSLLAAVEHLRRDSQPLSQLLQNVFSSAAVELPFDRQTGREVHEFMIQHRYSHLK